MPINHWGDVNGRQPILFPRLSSGGKEINHVLTAQTKTEHWSLVEISARLFCFCPTALTMVNSHRRDNQNYWKLLVKSRFFKNRELYWSNLPQNSNLGRESFVQKSGVQIPVGEGQIFCHFSFFIYLFYFVHKKLNIKT